jgi:hypothetical protein
MSLFKNKAELGWSMYDWANSAFTTTIMAGFFPVFFKEYWSAGAEVTVSTAKRAIRLHQISRSDPALFARIAPLGVAKAMVLITLPPPLLEQLFAGPHLLPESGAQKALASMTYAELMSVIVALGKHDDEPDAATLLLRAYRQQVRALIGTLDALMEAHDGIAEDDVAELHDDLVDVTARFAGVFSLDDD